MKKILLFSIVSLLLSCNSSGGGGAISFSPGAVVQGLNNVAEQIGEAGGALAGGAKLKLKSGGISAAELASEQCTVHADPGSDVDNDGEVEESERMSESDPEYALKKIYCTLSLESTGPETVKGAMQTLNMIVCAVEKQYGSEIPFDGVQRSLVGLRIDLSCATQADLDDMSGTSGQSSITLDFDGTWESTLTPSDFAETPNSNDSFNHGIRLHGTMEGNPFTVVALAKFDEETVDESFEFATFVQGLIDSTRSEVTAGKFVKTSPTAGELWFEYRDNRHGSGFDPDRGFSRHTRIHTNAVYDVNGNLESVSNFSGILTDSYLNTDDGGADNFQTIITAVGPNMTSGITAEYLTRNGLLSDPTTLFSSFTSQKLSCVQSTGGITEGACIGGEMSIAPSTNVLPFLQPGGNQVGDNSTWFAGVADDGIGFSGDADISVDIQTAP